MKKLEGFQGIESVIEKIGFLSRIKLPFIFKMAELLLLLQAYFLLFKNLIQPRESKLILLTVN